MSNWHTTRLQWNADNQCAREACRGPLPTDHENFNTGSELFYCDHCTRLISKHAPELFERRTSP